MRVRATSVVQPSSFGAAIGVHAALLVTLAALLQGGPERERREVVPLPERLVWVEPAPPPLAGEGRVAGEAVRDREVVRAREPERPRVPERVPRTAAPVRAAPRTQTEARKPVPPPRPSDERPVDGTLRDPGSTEAKTSLGRLDGAPTGVAGGVAGGLGEAPLALAVVARPPELVSRGVPDYPVRARALAVEGQVVLEMVLDREGRPEADVHVVRSVPLLDAAAVAAVRQWRFRPARDAEGRAVRVIMQVPVRFELR